MANGLLTGLLRGGADALGRRQDARALREEEEARALAAQEAQRRALALQLQLSLANKGSFTPSPTSSMDPGIAFLLSQLSGSVNRDRSNAEEAARIAEEDALRDKALEFGLRVGKDEDPRRAIALAISSRNLEGDEDKRRKQEREDEKFGLFKRSTEASIAASNRSNREREKTPEEIQVEELQRRLLEAQVQRAEKVAEATGENPGIRAEHLRNPMVIAAGEQAVNDVLASKWSAIKRKGDPEFQHLGLGGVGAREVVLSRMSEEQRTQTIKEIERAQFEAMDDALQTLEDLSSGGRGGGSEEPLPGILSALADNFPDPEAAKAGMRASLDNSLSVQEVYAGWAQRLAAIPATAPPPQLEPPVVGGRR